MTLFAQAAKSPDDLPQPRFLNFYETATSRAQIMGTLAAVLNVIPDTALVEALKSTGGSFWEGLQQYAEMSAEVQQGLFELSRFAEQMREQPNAVIVQSLKMDWTRLFRGLSPGYGPMPPYEALFTGKREDEVDILRSIAHVYREHGLEIVQGLGNRPDYLGVEFDFLRYLSQKEAEAWFQGDQEGAIRYNQALSTFFSQHVGNWAPDFCVLAAASAVTDFYRGFLHLVKGIIDDANRQYVKL